MDTITLFKQAAQALQKDPLYLQLVNARQLNDNDTKLQDIIGEFNLVRLALNNEVAKEQKNEERIKELDEQINCLYSEIMANPSMLAYNSAKQDINGLVNYINSIVSAAIDGEDPMKVEQPQKSCSADGCASCAGCG